MQPTVPVLLWQTTSFTIEACSPQGIRFDDGGDNFFVCIRATGTRFRAKIVDNGDGSYKCTYKPTVSGRCSIAVSLLGDPLPGSPFAIVVSSPTPSAQHCIVQSQDRQPLSMVEWKTVAHAPETFMVSFRDERGNITHAAELDVYAHRAPVDGTSDGLSSLSKTQRSSRRVLSPRAESRRARSPPHSPKGSGQRGLPSSVSLLWPASAGSSQRGSNPLKLELSHLLHANGGGSGLEGPGAGLLRSMNDFENLVVGEKGLPVTKEKDPDSEHIGQLPSGHTLKLLRLEVVTPKPKPKSPKPFGSAGKRSWLENMWSGTAGETNEGEGDDFGMLRACVVFEEPNPAHESWRQLYNADQDWRTLSWREHSEELEGSMRDASETPEASARGQLVSPPSTRRSATSSRSTARSSQGTNRSNRGGRGMPRKKLEVNSMTKPAIITTSASGNIQGIDQVGMELTVVQEEETHAEASAAADPIVPEGCLASSTEDTAATPSPAGARTLTDTREPTVLKDVDGSEKTQHRERESREGRSRRNRGPREDQNAKKKAKAEAEAKAAAERMVEDKIAEEKAAVERAQASESALVIQAHARGRAGRQLMYELREAKRQEEEDAKAEAEARASSEADAALTRVVARETRQQRKAPLTPGIPLKIGKTRGPTFGWVTISMDQGQSLVGKQMGLLPAHVRREQMAIWHRRYAIDSARERDRARVRDEEAEILCLEELAAKARASKVSVEGETTKRADAAGKDATGGSPATSPTRKSTSSNFKPQIYPTHQTKELLYARSDPRLHGAPVLARAVASTDAESSVKTPVPIPRISLSRGIKEAPRLPRAAYLEELEADPRRIGFAYGGMTPGRHTSGKPVEFHAVNFSFGVSGKYLLHVGLRSTSKPLPGSPFTVAVVPGVAHPLSTMITPSDLSYGAIRGYLQSASDSGTDGSILSSVMGLFGSTQQTKQSKSSSRTSATAIQEAADAKARLLVASKGSAELMGQGESCGIRLFARDKMGNLCIEGGAAVTCGVLGAEHLESTCEDRGNGTYVLRWWMKEPGAYKVFVKIDEIHVLGSPTTAVIEVDKVTAGVAAEKRRRRNGVEKYGDEASAQIAAAAAAAVEEEEQLAAISAQEAAAVTMEAERVRREQEQAAESRARIIAIKVLLLPYTLQIS